MANRCPGCGGTLRFDIQKQKLVCDYCNSEFDSDSIEEVKPAEEGLVFNGQSMEAKIFTCPNCGAEVFATDLDAVEYCSYCGTFVTLQSRLAKIQKPSYIVPFNITKEKCLELYKEELKKSYFLPKYMNAENAESNLKNFYIPFWGYSQKFKPDADVKFKTTVDYTEKDADFRQRFDTGLVRYNATAKISGGVDGMIFDASSNLDDRISEGIKDFPVACLKPFKGAVMAGSYADVADVRSETYTDDACAKGLTAVAGKIQNKVKEKEAIHIEVKYGKSAKFFTDPDIYQTPDDYCDVDSKLAMLPVWFLTYKNKKRVFYSVINGFTGKIFAAIPVDIKKYLFWSFVAAIPFFLILELLFGPAFNYDFANPKNANVFWLYTLLAALGEVFLDRRVYLKKLDNEINRVDDKGYRSLQSGNSDKKKKKIDFTQVKLIIALVIAYIIVKGAGEESVMPGYVATIINIIVIFASIASKVKVHNLACSRPVPHFFDKRKEAGK